MAAPLVNIYFGSQSGTAECFSEEIRDEAAAEHGLNCNVVDFETFTPDDFAACPIAVLVVSTYGEGEPSDNAVKFHKWVMDPRNNGALKGQRFCVMGLGDMNYARFNNMGVECDAALERMGGTRIYQRGIGDDSQDIAADFQAWKGGGLFASLKAAIADVQQENPGGAPTLLQAASAAVKVAAPPAKVEFHMFVGHEEADGAAKDVCEALTAQLKDRGFEVPIVQCLSQRKACEQVRKIPKRSIAVVINDVGPEGVCSSGKKLIRNMNLELDAHSLTDKELSYTCLTIATSKCNNSAQALRSQIEQDGKKMAAPFERVGMKPVCESVPCYVDAGVESVEPVVTELCNGLEKAATSIKEKLARQASPQEVVMSKAESAGGPAAKAAVTKIFCSGDEAQEAGEALASAWPNGGASHEEAALSALASAAQQRAQVLLAVEVGADGGLCDATRGLVSQLKAAPMALQAQLRQLRYAMITVAATDYGNAGERASANAARAELTRASAPITQTLEKFGAKCISSETLDLQDTAGAKLGELCARIQNGFTDAVAASKSGASGNDKDMKRSGATAVANGTPVLRMAATKEGLPQEGPSEPSDVVAKFYFEADKAKVKKVQELRQKPDADGGFSTVEVEIEAAGALKGYAMGGTLSLLAESDPADVRAMLPLLGLAEADLNKFITFVAAEGQGLKVKRPFPTPCTLGEALSRYCDLARAPTKKMLTAIQSKLDPAAQQHVGKLLADAEALKLLQAAPLCCTMPEFWSLVGASCINPSDFLLHCPRQKAREFTIASSPAATPEKITLCVSLTSHEPADVSATVEQLRERGCIPSAATFPATRGRFYGRCSRWLSTRLKTGDVVFAKQRSSALRLPEKDVPIIMVGSGAGVAPFRGFWQELQRKPKNSPAALFFGCRHPDQDWLFKDEMNSSVKPAASGCAALQRVQACQGAKRPLQCLFTAFSRPGDGKEGKYVQDQIKAQKQSVKHWIDNMSGAVYICGSTAMGNGVLEALADILDGGKEKVETLRKDGRIVAEMWG